jgi:hypothetical protein
MKPPILALALVYTLLLQTKLDAALITINVSGEIRSVDGTYSPDLSVDDAINAVFAYDTDELYASSSDTNGSTDPGHEYSSFYEFSSPPYGGSVTHVASSGTFTGDVAAVVVNNNLSNGGDDLDNIIAANTYDWIEILSSNTVDGVNGYPSDGEEWTLAFFSSDTSWITDGSLIPDNLPANYTPILVGQEFDVDENVIGVVFVDINSITFTAVPEPASVSLLGLGSIALLIRRKRG